jgi:hypothetical protein
MKCFQEEIENIKDSFAEVNPKGDLIEFVQQFSSNLIIEYDHYRSVALSVGDWFVCRSS